MCQYSPIPSALSTQNSIATNTSPVDLNTPSPVLQESTTTTSIPSEEPLFSQFAAASPHLNQLLNKATAHGLPGLTSSMFEELHTNTERPRLFSAGYLKYTDMENAAKACDAAANELSRLPAKAFRQSDNNALTILKQYTQAQNAMSSAIQKFMDATPYYRASLAAMQQATQFRISEALNFAGMLMTTDIPNSIEDNNHYSQRLDSMTMREGMAMLSPHMHGQVVKKTLCEAQEFFTALKTLEDQKADISAETFTQNKENLLSVLRGLKNNIQTILLQEPRDVPTSNAEVPHSTLHMNLLSEEYRPAHTEILADISLLQKLNTMLEASEKRIKQLTDINCAELTKSAISQSMQLGIQANSLELLKSLIPANLFSELTNKIEQYTKDCNSIQNMILQKKDAVTIYNTIKTSVDNLRSEDVKHACGTIKLCYYFITNKINKKYLLQNLCQVYNQNDANYIINKVKKLNKNERNALCNIYPSMENSLINLPQDILDAELNSMSAILTESTNLKPESTLKNEFLLEAMEHAVDLNTIIEARLRKFPSESLEMQCMEGALITETTLGHGQTNTVQLCTYKEDDGIPHQKIFKPERPARVGLSRMKLNNFGYSPDVQVMKLNIASGISAHYIGCNNVIAHSSIGTLHGQFGLFMDRAPGCAAGDLSKEPCGFLPNGTTLTLEQTITALKKNNKFETMRANLMRECCNLEWADILSGQTDRHSGNYLIAINAENGDVKLTGIDNDGAFTYSKVGMTHINIKKIPTEKQQQLTIIGLPIQNHVLDATNATDSQLTELRNIFGINQFYRPTHIDQKTYTRLMSIDEESYRESLNAYMSKDSVDAAILRLKDAQNYARELNAKNKVVQDWKLSTVFDDIKDTRKDIPLILDPHSIPIGGILKLGFFARDLLPFFV